MSTSSVAPRSVTLPSARVLVGAVYAICVLGLVAVFVADIVFTDKDPHRSDGPIVSMVTIGIMGTSALLIVVGLGLWLGRTPERARVGAVMLGALSVLTVIVFWSGVPGILGAGAAWLAGLTRGGHPLGGAARVAGLVGVFIALLNVVISVGGVLLPGIS
jgi:hypothetical protein